MGKHTDNTNKKKGTQKYNWERNKKLASSYLEPQPMDIEAMCTLTF